ncbi:twp-component sensor histidine kinase [Arcticibacter svalbardensis MN12-7]|uniref:histidine kinase n=2 Tax=Arcticibacter TaxID=1288026 RepID=R9GQ24_9SPHI|nr:twp-component sensor histidine kinase [Arcticibacter svalbardensis MN12-7]
MDDQLEEELMEVKQYTAGKNNLYQPNSFEELIIQYKKTAENNSKIIADTVFYNDEKHRMESARYLQSTITLKGEQYKVTIIASKVENEEQIKSILKVIILPVLALLVILLLVNRFMIRSLWNPFKQLLINIKAFNVNQDVPFKPVKTSIKEFSDLNNAFVDLSSKVKSDYKEIKLFTENASHEMMTPLAVINSKLDTMLQSNLLGREESELLTDMYKATSRLTKLNQSLLMLVKIDNNLLNDQEDILISKAIEEKLLHFQELILKRKLTIHLHLEPTTLFISQQLLEILLNNLFSNAIRHNIEKGTINISLTATQLIFSNTSTNDGLDEAKIFERFYKDTTSEGTGLGLSILKQICNRLQYDLKYTYDKPLHHFIIQFNK